MPSGPWENILRVPGPVSRCTKLGDLENMDRFVALNWETQQRIALN